jgi:hypothetical protein
MSTADFVAINLRRDGPEKAAARVMRRIREFATGAAVVVRPNGNVIVKRAAKVAPADSDHLLGYYTPDVPPEHLEDDLIDRARSFTLYAVGNGATGGEKFAE